MRSRITFHAVPGVFPEDSGNLCLSPVKLRLLRKLDPDLPALGQGLHTGLSAQWAWPIVQRKIQETLQIYPRVKGIQVMNDMGDYMFPQYAGRWMQDSESRRRDIVQLLGSWSAQSNSSPVEGIRAAITTFYSPDRKISIYVFGDDFSGRSIEDVVDTVDQLNRVAEDGTRRVRIHAVGFPVVVGSPSGDRFAALMRELTYRNNGTFVALPRLE